MRKNTVIISLLLAFGLILSACGGQAAATQDPAQLASTVAALVDAQVATKMAQAVAATQAQQQAQATNTPLIPTVGNLPTIAPVNQPTAALPGVATTSPCNPPPLSIYENLPDGYQLYIDTPFNKSWTIQNAGTCTWNANYKIKFVSGDQMSGPASQSFNATTRPGENLTITLALKTTNSVGTSTGYWGLYDDKDVYFGRVWVTINRVVVAPTTTAFSVTRASTAVDAAHACGGSGTFTFTTSITTDRSGDVTYELQYPHGTAVKSNTVTFGSATTKSDTLTWDASTISPGAATYTMWLYITSPNHQYFTGVDFTCT